MASHKSAPRIITNIPKPTSAKVAMPAQATTIPSLSPLPGLAGQRGVLTPQHVLQLQRTIGNRAVMQILNAPTSQQPVRAATQPIQLKQNDVVQRVIPGLDHVKTIADIADQWVTDYIADVTHPTSHLYDEDIITYLDNRLATWRTGVTMHNTGGNHWDVQLTMGNQTISVQTTPDGNCGIHAIHAVLSKTKFNQDVVGHSAPASLITHVRQAVQARIGQDRNEIKQRILLEIQRSTSSIFTGFGPQLQARLGISETEARRKQAEQQPPSPSTSNDTTTLPPTMDIGLDRFARFKRLLKEHVPRKMVERMMMDEKIPEQAIKEFFDSYSSSSKGKEVALKTTDPSSQVPLSQRDEVRERVLEIERDLMDLVDFEEMERQYLVDLRQALTLQYQPQFDAYRDAKKREKTAEVEGKGVEEAQEEAQRLAKEWGVAKEKVKARLELLEQQSKKKISQKASYLQEIVTDKRIKWVGLMEELCGTHFVKPGVQSSGSYGLAHRHDAKPGEYGKTPTKEDSQIGHRQVEVLHGHGGWYRTGTVTEGLLNDDMPGLTSLGEIIERANQIRATKKLMALPLDKVDLAFLDYHGSTIMMGKVMKGAYPDLMPIPLDLHKQVVTLMEEATSAKKNPDEYIKSKTGKTIPNETPPRFRRTGFAYPDRFQWTNKALYDAYERVRDGTASGKSAEYVDILEATTHKDVKFPDSRLGHLHGVEQGEKAMKAVSIPGYHISTVNELRDETLISGTVSANLSDAIVDRLTQIEVDERPIRIIWAGCRSEQWRTEMTDEEFMKWIRQAATSRRKAIQGNFG